MLRFWSPQKFPETLKTLGKTRYSGQTRIPPGGGNRKKPYKTNRKWGILSKREAGPRASLGQPSAGKKNGCRLAAMARPGSGRPERGKQNGFPKSGHPFFFPRSVTSFFPRGKNGFISASPLPYQLLRRSGITGIPIVLLLFVPDTTKISQGTDGNNATPGDRSE